MDPNRGLVFSERGHKTLDPKPKPNSLSRKDLANKQVHKPRIPPQRTRDSKGDFQPINPLFYVGGKKGIRDSMNRHTDESAVSVSVIGTQSKALKNIESKKSLISVGSSSLHNNELAKNPSHQFLNFKASNYE